MDHKSLLSFRKSHGEGRGEQNDAGIIVVLMMALVFVPIVAAHVAMSWHDPMQGIGTQQLAAAVNVLLSVF